MTEQKAEFNKHRDQFIEAFKDSDNDKINDVLNDLPSNIRPADDNNLPKRIFEWKGCPLFATASYYAGNKVNGEDYPVPEIDELKALLDEKKETPSQT